MPSVKARALSDSSGIYIMLNNAHRQGWMPDTRFEHCQN